MAERIRVGLRRRRWIATGAGLLIVAGVLALFRPPRAPVDLPPRPSQVVGLLPPAGSERDPVAAEEAEFGDPTPLFMPTRWNSSQEPLPRPEIAGSFPGFGPRFEFEAASLKVQLAPSVAVPSGSVEALVASPPGNPSLGYGRVDVSQPKVAARQARIEVVAESSGLEVWRHDLPVGAVPALDGREWHSLDLMGVADEAGLVGSLVPSPGPVERTGNYFPPLDGDAAAALENYLIHELLLGVRLPPGFYRISIGP